MEQTASINIVLTKRSHTGVMAWLLAYLNLEQMLVYCVLVSMLCEISGPLS